MDQSSLLINEPPLSVLPSLAAAVGLNEAIVLQQLHYWLENKKTGVLREDGHKWIFNSYEEWQENFPFWSPRTVQRIFLDLEHAGLIISAQFDKATYDRRKYYRLNYDQLRMIDSAKLAPSMTPKLARSLKGTTETTVKNNKDDNPDANTSNVFVQYEANIGPLTPIMVDRLKDAEQKYSEAWVLDAIALAVEHNKRNWAYCMAILKNSQEQNIRPGLKKLEKKNAHSTSHSKRTKQSRAAQPTEYTDADREAADAINNDAL